MPSLDMVRILVLERSSMRAQTARRLLEGSGARVSLAATASAACAAALSFQPELIVSGAGFASADWHPVLRLLADAPPALLVWRATSPPEEVAELALRLYAGSRR
jgi:CheY-like chemotaxis protein